MQVLMISYDYTMVQRRSAKIGDSLERHIKYSNALRVRYPDGHLTIIVKVPPNWDINPVDVTSALTIYPIPSERFAFPFLAYRQAQYLFSTQSYDLVTTQNPFDDGLVALWVRKRYKTPVNVQIRGSFLDNPHWVEERFVYRLLNIAGKMVIHRADTVRVISYGEKKRLEAKFPQIHGKVFVLPPFINTRTFEEPLQNEEADKVISMLKQRFGSPDRFFLFVGRLVKEKNIDTLLRAFSLLHKRQKNCALVVIGDGPLFSQLKSLADDIGINHRILWLGVLPITELRPWYALAMATILPSHHEGFGKVVVESYLGETPVIASPFVSARELIKNGETGYILSDAHNISELAAKMEAFLKHPNVATRMGRLGKNYLKTHYLLPEAKYMEQLITIWEETARRRR